MAELDPRIQTSLPENAYRELKPGESYVPMVPPGVTVPEITPRSILFGLAMNVLFAMAATYLALKVGQGIETAIPISILAVGLSGFLLKIGLRRSTIIENINILAISTTSGMVAGGTVFTMPAIYLLGLNKELNLSGTMIFMHIFLVPFLGAIFGVLFLVPFRRYFVKEMHGKLPFPEATATNEILVTGQSGGSNALILVYSFVVASIYTFMTAALRLWPADFTTGKLEIGWTEKVGKAAEGATAAAATAASAFVDKSTEALAFTGKFWTDITERIKAVVEMGTGAEFLGLGFIIGVRYASIIMAGSFLSFLVITPLLAPLSLEALQSINPAISNTDAQTIFSNVPKNIGIGCIFTAGLLSILKMGKVIVTALREALGSLFRKSAGPLTIDRTDEDISYPALAFVGLITTVVMAAYFRFLVFNTMESANFLTIISVLLALGVAFIFITVSAWAIATISVTPISGMTVTTIIVTAVVLSAAGLGRGPNSQLAVLLVGGVVASALSVAGTLVSEFKLGYWAGASPKRIQWSCIIACVLASAVVSLTIMMLAKSPGYDPEVSTQALQAPQANLMKSALDSFLGTGQVPWLPYCVGVVVALALELVKVSPLAFGLGMYLPMGLNLPILVGALVAAAVTKGKADQATMTARRNKGIIIASGFIAGAAIIGVLLNGLGSWSFTEDFIKSLDIFSAMVRDTANPEAKAAELGRMFNWFGLLAFGLLCLFIFWDARRAKPEEGAPEIHM
ncbi:MAG: OPT/YSL family transporter [Phycisphaerae bacterium]|nr:OPT/YSL family transporter [Phycisphaerae bacterium]